MESTTLLHIASLISTGALVGLAVGLTGVGGGSLMTPALISIFGVAPAIAVGTDLAFAAATKSAGVVAHRNSGAIVWPIVGLMIAGSTPACLLALWVMHGKPAGSSAELIKTTLGIALLATALAVLLKGKIKAVPIHSKSTKTVLTLVLSALIGWLVAWSSIGAGAVGCTVLALIYGELEPRDIAATDIAYAVPLTAIAATGHALQGNIDWTLLLCLLVGSVPAIWFGVRLSARLSQGVARGLLATLLATAAIKALSF